jgi:hypothetical protein
VRQGLPANAPVAADEATAAVRMFLSTIGWHVADRAPCLVPDEGSGDGRVGHPGSAPRRRERDAR